MIGLVACSAQKLDRPAPARLLYCSPLFRKSLAYAADAGDAPAEVQLSMFGGGA